MQWLQRLSLPLRLLAYASAVVVVLAVAAGVGVLTALTLGPGEAPPEQAKPERTGEATSERAAGAQYEPTEEVAPGGGGGSEDSAEESTLDASDEAAYLEEIAETQNEAVEAALRSNERLVRYDRLTAADIEGMRADAAALGTYYRRVRDLDPPSEYGDQREAFVIAIRELRNANELAHRLASEPASATQADFEAYDRHIDSATSHLRRSNEVLGEDHKTAEAAQEVSLG